MSNVVVLDFFADWCGPCKVLSPILESVASELGIKVTEIDVDRFPDAVSEYNVQSMPTLVVFKDGDEVKRLVGSRSRDRLLSELSDL